MQNIQMIYMFCMFCMDNQKEVLQLPLLIIMSILCQKEILNNTLVPNADHRTVIDLPLPEFRHRESRTRIVDVHTRIDEPHLSRCCVDEGIACDQV